MERFGIRQGVAIIAITTLVAASSLSTQILSDAPDLIMYARIRDEGNTRSQVMNYASELMDGIGPRLTGSPNLEKAIVWAMNRLAAAGSSNVRKESWGDFGMGWRQRNVWARLVEPYPANFIVTAAPWSPATAGPIAADVAQVRGFNDEKGFEPLRGTLRGKIVLLGRSGGLPEVFPIDKPLSERLDAARLADLAQPASESDGAGDRARQALEGAFANAEFAERIGRLFADEGVRAVMVPSGNNPRGGASGGTIYSDSNYNLGMYAHQKARAMRVPLVIVATEEYLRMERLLERKVPVKVELNVDVEFTGDRV